MRIFWFAAVIALIVCGGSMCRVNATVFRDRAAFNVASQNLQTIDFESIPRFFENDRMIDGVSFNSIGGIGFGTGVNGNKTLVGQTVGEITLLTIHLPPGTTAVGCDQFTRPMIVSISTGDSVMMDPSDGLSFVGFVSDQPIQSLVISLDFPEPTPSAVVDNLSYGQRRAGNEPPAPLLLITNDTLRAVVLDSVTKEREPFHVLSTHNLASDKHTRLTLFVVGVSLISADRPFVTVEVVDSQQHLFNLEAEATERVKNLSWMSQVTVRLPDSVSPGDVNCSVTVRGVKSNKALLRIE
ncbi:MAG TPA: hypothetical protein VIG25_18430 [Pyrinomonadaceae bacterium]